LTNLQASVFIAGYYGFDNAGDEAILRCMVEHLRALRPSLEITVASRDPKKTAARFAVCGVRWNDIRALCSAVERCGLVLVGGGGLFHDYWGVDPDAFLTSRHGGVVCWAAPAILAMLCEKPLMLYAVGVGPLLSEHGRRFTRAACDAANVVTVRDPGSKELLEAIGVAPDKVAVTADPTFAFAPDGGATITGQPPLAGVSLRHWAIGTDPESWQRKVAAGLDAFLEKRGGSILFLPFQTCAGEWEYDPRVIGRVRSFMRAQGSTRVVPDSSPEALYAAIGKCDVVLGMRLHSLVFAFLNRRPFVALSYDPKVGEFVRASGVGDFVVDISAVDAQSLSTLLSHALACREHFGAALDGRRQELARLARENACLAIKLLETPGAGARMVQSAAPILARWLKAGAVLEERPPAELHRARKVLADSATHLRARFRQLGWRGRRES
jgi:polysaccharide pyruvyl transferase CsaB